MLQNSYIQQFHLVEFQDVLSEKDIFIFLTQNKDFIDRQREKGFRLIPLKDREKNIFNVVLGSILFATVFISLLHK
jgi:hypothetical protein